MKQIVGIVLVKDEDLFIEQVLRNVALFCDKIIVADHLSSDGTAEKVNLLRNEVGKITYHIIKHPRASHELISEYAASPTWIFAVDGDELYDPSGLAVLRQKILSGDFDGWWMILGNVLHCIELNQDEQYAVGHLTPPCRSMTKLYNFSKITSWQGPCPERLHGGTISFVPGYSMAKRLLIYEQMEWEISFFRCLHLCFLPRSSKDLSKSAGPLLRRNISDKNSERLFYKIFKKIPFFSKYKNESFYKKEMYMRGPIVKEKTETFFLDETM